ncbi:ARID DNA-binding domain-containing protein [Tanacetum coccineum]|uniref:ARID DNA-binding domain-containing protein n=1 Tax=Tanacetum coccineum TaxID=301880 RepID=A0ABQ5IX04_9ASTR
MDSMGGYLSVHFGLEFGALAEILGLTRSDGEEIRKCYMTYLEAFRGASSAEGKGKEKLEHFGIKLEEEEDCKLQQSTHYGGKESQTTCYKCQDTGHYAFEYPEKNKRKGQTNYSSYMEPSTSKFGEGEDSHSTSSPRLIIFKPANIGSLGQRPTGVLDPLVHHQDDSYWGKVNSIAQPNHVTLNINHEWCERLPTPAQPNHVTLNINHEWCERLPTPGAPKTSLATIEIEEVVSHTERIIESEKQEEAAYTNKENNA